MKIYYEIVILDACGNEYDTISARNIIPNTLKDCALRIIEMKKHDKELGSEYGVWDYRIVRYEETEEELLYTIYKLYKYRGQYKVKEDTELFI